MPTEQSNPYNELPTDHEIVEKYKPKFLARGGDHLVYEVEGHPDIVIKASSFVINDVLSENFQKGLPLDSLEGEARDRIEEEVRAKNESIGRLRKYFGKEHTLNERRLVMKVPVSPAILAETFKDDWEGRTPAPGSENLTEAWSIVVIQERSEEINNPHSGFYYGKFLEKREPPISDSDYQKMNEVLIRGAEKNNEAIGLFLKFQDNPKTHALNDLLIKAYDDKVFRDTLVELVEKIVSYAEETGHMLALAGEDNIILYPKDGGWSYLLLDALPIHNEAMYKVAKDTLAKISKEQPVSEEEKVLTVKVLNFVRTINGLCASLGLLSRLELVEDKEKVIDFSVFRGLKI